MNSIAQSVPAMILHRTPGTEQELSALVSLQLTDGDRVRLDFTSKRTGAGISIMFTRKVDLTCGRLGCTGFFVDVLDGDRFRYLCTITNAQPARGWKIGRTSTKCTIQDTALIDHARWLLCELFCVPHGKATLLRGCEIQGTVRFASGWSASFNQGSI